MATASGALSLSATIAPSTITESGDAEFDRRQLDPGDAERAACRHHQHERRRHEPERASAELPGEDADRDHRQHVVEPAERMREALHEAVHVADAAMRQGGGRDEREGGGDRSKTTAHGGFLSARRRIEKNCISRGSRRRKPRGLPALIRVLIRRLIAGAMVPCR